MQYLSPSFCLKVSSGFSPFFSIPVCLFGGCPGSSLLRNIIPLFFSVIENFYIIYFLPLYYIIVTYIAILYLFLVVLNNYAIYYLYIFLFFLHFFIFTYSLFTKSFFFILLFYFLKNYDSNRHAVLSSGCSGRTMQEY